MPQQRVILWWMLFIGIVCHMFQMININVAIVSMVKEPNRKANSSVTGGFCHPHDANNYTNIEPIVTTFADEPHKHATANDGDKVMKFDWNEQEQNVVISGYYWLTWASELVGGLLAHKFGSKITFGFTTFFACVLSSAIPVLARVNSKLVFVVRLLQGTIGSVGLPAGIFTIIGHWAPPHERGKFSSAILGISIGISAGYFIFGLVDQYLGWEYVFHVTSILGAIWYLLWYYMVFDTPDQHPRITEEEKLYIKKCLANTASSKKLPIPWKEIFTSVPVLVNILCAFGQNWCLISFNLYVPMYLKNVHDMSTTEIGILNGTAFLVRSALQVAGGIATDYMIKKGSSRTRVRKLVVLISSVILGVSLFGMIFAGCNATYATFIICSCIILSAICSSGTPVALIDMSPNFCGVIQGIALAIATTSGFINPAVFSYLSLNYETLTSWGYLFFITGLVNFVPGLLFLLLGSSELQSWNTPKTMKTSEEQQKLEINETKINES